jgi:predicted alpha/beta-hydrolase family hydrolase
VLLDTWRAVVSKLGGGERLVIGGKSMGGRMASMVADELGVLGVACLGYPFHPSGKSERTRTEHLERLSTPMLVVQGERDPMGRPEEIATYQLSDAIEVRWAVDGDHSLKPRRASGRTHEDNLAEAVAAIVSFVERVSVAR